MAVIASHFKIYTDGGARGNPGPAAAGFVIYGFSGKLLFRGGEYLGEATNNTAEYKAVLLALQNLINRFHPPSPVAVDLFLDSRLVCEQLKGAFKIKQFHLIALAQSVHQWENQHHLVLSYHSIPREQNQIADTEVNRVLDLHLR